MVDPRDELKTPTSKDPIPDLVENILGGTQYVSPSYWLGWVAEKATGTNPWGWAAEQFAGDWEAVAKAGDAIENLSRFNDVYAANVRSGVAAVGYGWQGKAAEAASSYFGRLAAALKEQVDDIGSLGREFKTVAIGMYETSNALKDLFQLLTDLLIVAAISAAAAAATSETIIGGILGGAATAASVLKAIGVWGTILEYHSAAWTAAQGFVGLCAGYLGALYGANLEALPSGGYDHPAV